MAQPVQPGTLARARAALDSPDYRKLLGVRLTGQGGDGICLVALYASVVFNVREQSTVSGLLVTTIVTIAPFTLLGPFVGVFIDRWSRRKILRYAPLLKVACVPLLLFDPARAAAPFFLGALAILSVNRFQLAAASAVVPRLVPADDLLLANSIATVGGTLASLVGAFVGGKISDTVGFASVLLLAAVAWLVSSLIAGRIRSDLSPLTLPEAPELLRHAIRRIVAETWDGARTMVRTPHTIWPITSITIDQVGQGVMLTLAIVVFRERLGEGVASFSNLLGAGGIGVLLGIATAGFLENHLSKDRIVAVAFFTGGVLLIAATFFISGLMILLIAGVLGLTFAWKKVSVDTLVQESLPDGYRGRVFSVYDFLYNIARIAAAAIAVVLFPAVSDEAVVVLVGVVFVLWTPVLPLTVGRTPQIDLVLDEKGHPVALRWGAAEEPVLVLAADGERYRLELADGSQIDVRPALRAPGWRVLREREG
jgi:predicted MFS family arabinose efflux permease